MAAVFALRPCRDVPEDVLHQIVQFLNLSEVAKCALVCRKWCTSFSSDRVWLTLSRRYFTALPLLRLTGGEIGTYGVSLPPTECVGAPAQARSEYIQKRHEFRAHQKDLKRKKHIDTTRPFVLHAALCVAWLASVIFLGLLIINAEGYNICSVDQTFNVLHGCYAIIFATIMYNVFTSAHYEPMPLMERVRRHSQLISLTGVSTSILIAFVFITKLIQYNVTAAEEDRVRWTICFTPVLSMLLFWQCLAVFAARPAVIRWLGAPKLPTLIELHAMMTTFFPIGLGIAIAALGMFIDTRIKEYLIYASVPYMFATMSVTGTFLLDFAAQHKFGDAVAAFSMANLSCLPVGFMLYEPRGLLLMPLMLFLCSFAASYVREWMKVGAQKRKPHHQAPVRPMPRKRL